MTQDEKQMLMIDLCGRLSYGVKCIDITPLEQFQDKNLWEIDRIRANVMDLGVSNCYECYGNYVSIHNIKPYLFPISSLTEKQKEEYNHIVNYISPDDTNNWAEGEFIYVDKGNYFAELLHFYNRYHIDYRGLIEKGLAIDATNKNIY